MTTAITLPASPLVALMPLTPTKDEKHRIGRFIQWLEHSDQQWWNPDVAAYVAYLRGVHGLSNHSISTHLATIRAQAGRLMHNNEFRQSLWTLATERGLQMDAAYAFVQEHITQIANAFHPSQAGVKQVKQQDKADADGLRLTLDQVQQLISAPGKGTLEGIRDTALLALMVCTGIRIAEAVSIKTDDLRQYLDGQLALRVIGKGNKLRLIPYGAMSWCLEHVQDWLEASAIKNGYVFRGFFRGGKLRPSALSTRAGEKILDKYPILDSGLKIKVEPHDLRRTYARRAYDAGMSTEALRDNMGHEAMKTTIGYIGTLNAEQRAPGAVFENPYQETKSPFCEE